MIESISKPKLPSGLAYALKTSQLSQALDEAGIDVHVDLRYWKPQIIGSIFETHYWPPSNEIPYPRVYIRAGCVPSPQRVDASEALATTGLPQFVRWLTGILSLPHGSPNIQNSSYLDVTYTDDRLTVSNTPRPKSRK